MSQLAATLEDRFASEPVLREDDGPVTILTLNRPDARNSLSEALLAALENQVDEIRRSSEVKAVVLTANGPVFSAGHDLKELSSHHSDADRGRAYFERILAQCSRLMQSIVHSPKPIIAAVTGTATAAGCQLVASCDLAVAGEEAKFCTPGVNMGLFCSTPMVALSRNVSRKRAMEMLLLGEFVSAADAEVLGLVNKVVPTDRVIAGARRMADRIAEKSSLTVSIGKEAFYRQIEKPLDEAYDYAAKVMVENMLARDAEEGMTAFLEKRPPRWRDG